MFLESWLNDTLVVYGVLSVVSNGGKQCRLASLKKIGERKTFIFRTVLLILFAMNCIRIFKEMTPSQLVLKKQYVG